MSKNEDGRVREGPPISFDVCVLARRDFITSFWPFIKELVPDLDPCGMGSRSTTDSVVSRIERRATLLRSLFQDLPPMLVKELDLCVEGLGIARPVALEPDHDTPVGAELMSRRLPSDLNDRRKCGDDGGDGMSCRVRSGSSFLVLRFLFLLLLVVLVVAFQLHDYED
ncbi:MAG: hypothetical protein UU10_C0009G0004 [Parcubacteria group bacterium GW2011_GWF1_40_6]|nr:MAG: hypothetical protein UU10_C0009G0004 [Parcubacteria group bacterium GW2011_GWF1_40_6]